MPDETLFRTARAELEVPEVVPEERSSDPIPKLPKGSDLPPSLRTSARQMPLITELIGATSAYEHFDMKFLSREADGYINGEIARLGLPDNKESYQKLLDEAVNKLALPEGVDVYTMLEKVVDYLRVQDRLYRALKDKEELLASDPLTLSATKLKVYMKSKHGIQQV